MQTDSKGAYSMKFFESEVVMYAIEEIMDLQTEVMLFAQYADYASLEQQRENINLLKKLMGKQKNMCFRCTLVDDPDAKTLLTEVLEHFVSHGHTVDYNDPIKVFDEVALQIQEMDDDLTYAEKHGYFPGEEPGGETPPYQL